MKDRTHRVVTPERLREVLSYDPATGEFHWLVSTGARARVGMRAGGMNGSGYRVISIDGISYRTSHLAWLYMTGEWPISEIDHKNRHRDDDRWENLRLHSRSEQLHNTARRSDNVSGYRDISWFRPRSNWRVRIYQNGKALTCKYFADIESALAARDQLRAEFGLPPAIDDNTALNSTLTPEEYRKLLIAQEGLCGCCGEAPGFSASGNPIALIVDRDGKTGTLRGLICRKCKESLGAIERMDPRVRARLLLFAEKVQSGEMAHDPAGRTITGPKAAFDEIDKIVPLARKESA